MRKYRLTNKALEDLKSIGEYTERVWSRKQRNKYLKRLDEGFEIIAHEPQIGAPCEHIRKGYRKFHVNKHLIFYLHTDQYVKIIRILHEKMDVDSHFDLS